MPVRAIRRNDSLSLHTSSHQAASRVCGLIRTGKNTTCHSLASPLESPRARGQLDTRPYPLVLASCTCWTKPRSAVLSVNHRSPRSFARKLLSPSDAFFQAEIAGILRGLIQLL